MAPGRGKAALRIDSDSDFESDATTTEAHVETGYAEVVDIDAEEQEEEEEEEEVYAGLAAEELRDERLYAGDTIEYYSMAFVFGDPRGYRVAKVLKVANREPEYPLRLDSQEMLPNTLMIKRQLTRRGEALEPGAAVWRKIRTFTLHDGEVQGKTRADRLNEGLKNAVTGAFQSLRTESSSQTKTKSSSERTTSSAHDGKRDKGTPRITSFFSKAPAKKGALEAVAAPRPASSSSSSYSSKSDRRPDGSSLVSKPLSKRSRVELTPSPSDHQRRRKDRDGSRTPPSSSASHKHKHERRPHHSSSSSHHSPHRHGHRPLKDKVDVTLFLEHIVEKKSDPRLDLNSYLKLDREEKEVIKEFDSKRKLATSGKDKDKIRPLSSSGGGGTSGNSTRMRASGGRSDANRGGVKGMKSMENYYKPPPRPHPTAKSRIETSPGDAKLNFFLGADNEARPSSASDHGKHLSRDAAKSPSKKGLSNTWLTKKR